MPKMLSRFAELVRVVYRRFQEDHGLQVASSLTFTTLLSLVPRLIVLDGGKVVADGPKEQVMQALAGGKINVAKH